MERVIVNTAYSDRRGVILDLVVDQIDAITEITFEKDAIRGNHFHKETTQWTYVVYGKIQAFTKNKDVVVSDIFKEGELFVSKPLEPHAMKAIIPSKILVFTQGPRSGENYHTDTFPTSIIEYHE
jgi:quercetin dioxygenase-like cupin family protein